MLGQFIARAIADHILPMSFLDCYKGKVDCEHARWAEMSKISSATSLQQAQSQKL